MNVVAKKDGYIVLEPIEETCRAYPGQYFYDLNEEQAFSLLQQLQLILNETPYTKHLEQV